MFFYREDLNSTSQNEHSKKDFYLVQNVARATFSFCLGALKGNEVENHSILTIQRSRARHFVPNGNPALCDNWKTAQARANNLIQSHLKISHQRHDPLPQVGCSCVYIFRRLNSSIWHLKDFFQQMAYKFLSLIP